MPNRATPKPIAGRALELFASCRAGCTEAMVLAHGFSIERMVERVNAGLATTHKAGSHRSKEAQL
jgi:hypothetical protein